MMLVLFILRPGVSGGSLTLCTHFPDFLEEGNELTTKILTTLLILKLYLNKSLELHQL